LTILGYFFSRPGYLLIVDLKYLISFLADNIKVSYFYYHMSNFFPYMKISECNVLFQPLREEFNLINFISAVIHVIV